MERALARAALTVGRFGSLFVIAATTTVGLCSLFVSPADPPSLATAVPNWRAGDTIPLGRRTLRVVRVRDDDADQPPVLVVQYVDE
jgi:hypothetical protein